MARRQLPPGVHLALGGAAVVFGVALFFYGQWQRRDPPPLPPPAAFTQAPLAQGSFHEQIDVALAELGLWPELVRKGRTPAGDRLEVRVPADLPLAEVNLHLTRLVERHNGQVLNASEHLRGQQVEIRCQAGGGPLLLALRRDPELKRRAGLIALVVEEFSDPGTSRQVAERFCALPYPLALAVLPQTDPFDPLLELARSRGHELLIHLRADERPDAEELRQQLKTALKKIPDAVGLGVPEADSLVVAEVLREARRHGLFLVDSRPSPQFDAAATARSLQMRAARGALFIDAVEERAAAEQQLWALAELAARQGRALGVGRSTESTLLALEAALPRLETRGFRIIPLSQLAQ